MRIPHRVPHHEVLEACERRIPHMGEHTPQWSLHKQPRDCMGCDHYEYSIFFSDGIVFMGDFPPGLPRSMLDGLLDRANNHDRLTRENEALRKALERTILANVEFRDQMPENWEGDPLQDACDEATAVLASLKEA